MSDTVRRLPHWQRPGDYAAWKGPRFAAKLRKGADHHGHELCGAARHDRPDGWSECSPRGKNRHKTKQIVSQQLRRRRNRAVAKEMENA